MLLWAICQWFSMHGSLQKQACGNICRKVVENSSPKDAEHRFEHCRNGEKTYDLAVCVTAKAAKNPSGGHKKSAHTDF